MKFRILFYNSEISKLESVEEEESESKAKTRRTKKSQERRIRKMALVKFCAVQIRMRYAKSGVRRGLRCAENAEGKCDLRKAAKYMIAGV